METKKEYIEPRIESIILDNEISLILESAPPTGPNEAFNNHGPDFFNINPFKNNVS